MKKETLEEAAEFWDAKQTILEFGKPYVSTNRPYAKAFIEGANWQQERMSIHILDVDNIYTHIENGVVVIEKNDKGKISYSEEEVKSFLDRYRSQFRMDKNIDIKQSDFIQWFNQNKKKEHGK